MKKKTLFELQRISSTTFKQVPKRPIALVLDNIRSGHNVGAAFRLSDAFLISHISLCGITPQPPHVEIRKTALGADNSVAWSYHKNTVDSLQTLKQAGYTLIGVEQAKESIMLADFIHQKDGAPPYALIFGNEVFGIQEEVLALVDYCLEIPQYGTKHSLNVAMCMGIVTWEVLKTIE